MTEIEEHPKEKMDIFLIGLYVLEVGLIGAVIYAMYVIPMWLKPVA